MTRILVYHVLYFRVFSQLLPLGDSGLEGVWGDCPSGLLGLRGFLGVMTSERKCQANAEKTLEAAGQEEW